jgi:hypothetical protein
MDAAGVLAGHVGFEPTGSSPPKRFALSKGGGEAV